MFPGSQRICIIDENSEMRLVVESLCDASHLSAPGFASTEAYLESDAWASTPLLLLHTNHPGPSGYGPYETPVTRGIHTPVIFMTGQDLAENLEKAGVFRAVACQSKPFHSAEALEAIHGRFAANRGNQSSISNH